MIDFAATRRNVTRNKRRYAVWDEHPHIGGWNFWRLFEDREWEPQLDDMLDQHLTPGSAFIDVGAWIGPVSLMASRICRHVHAIEPDLAALKRLHANVARSRKKNITIYETAISDHDGVLQIGRRADRQWGDSMTSPWFTAETLDVPCTTLRQLITDRRISNIGLIKMDIEGGEELALPPSAGFIHDLGVPLLLSTHTALSPSPDQYQATITSALDKFEVRCLSGRPGGLATLLAVPR
jgi:FkbM family methyltransferase